MNIREEIISGLRKQAFSEYEYGKLYSEFIALERDAKRWRALQKFYVYIGCDECKKVLGHITCEGADGNIQPCNQHIYPGMADKLVEYFDKEEQK